MALVQPCTTDPSEADLQLYHLTGGTCCRSLAGVTLAYNKLVVTQTAKSFVRAPVPSHRDRWVEAQLATMSAETNSVFKPESQLLVGQSVLSQAQDSTFGDFYKAYANIQDGRDDFSLPTVIVVGAKNQGKSSLLENITKCRIFPRDTSQCTKMPIRLRLRQVALESQCTYSVTFRGQRQVAKTSQDILPLITKIMESTDELSDEEIVVEITQTATPPFDFIDLPGLHISPTHRSEEIMWKYINEQATGTVILCVIEGTSGALDASASLQKLHQANQLRNTILVLTKADKVLQDEDDLNMLFSRLLGRWTGHEYLDQLAGCIAVANRKHTDRVSLVQHDEVEKRLFEDMLGRAQESLQPAFTPEELQRLKNNMSSKQLILKLEAEYNKHIVQDWIPPVKDRAVSLLTNAYSQREQLGMRPDKIVVQDLLRELHAQVSFQTLCSDVGGIAKDQLQGTASSFLPSFPAYDNIARWAEAVVEFEEHLKAAVDAVMQPGLYMEVAIAAYNLVLEQDPQLRRFPGLQLQLCADTGAIQHHMKEALMFAKPDVDGMVKTALQQVYNAALPAADVQHVFSALKDSIGNCIVKYLIQYVKRKPLFVSSSFQLEEDEHTQQLRNRYTQDMKRYQDVGDAFNRIARRWQGLPSD